MSEQKISKEIAELQRKHYDEWPEDDRTCVTPLLELLQAVPLDARMTYEHPDGNGYTMIPVGPHCRAAADRITELEQEVERLHEIVAGLPWTEKEIVIAENEALKMRVAILESCEARFNRLLECMQEFVDRCEKGEVRSRYTYRKFKAAIAEAQKETPGEG
jgi:hypothetical protein